MATRSSSSIEGLINHYGAIRLRSKGSATLQLTLTSLDRTLQNALIPITLSSLTNVEPLRLSNFTQQRASLEIRTTQLNENFQISKVVIYIKPVASSYPI